MFIRKQVDVDHDEIVLGLKYSDISKEINVWSYLCHFSRANFLPSHFFVPAQVGGHARPPIRTITVNMNRHTSTKFTWYIQSQMLFLRVTGVYVIH